MQPLIPPESILPAGDARLIASISETMAEAARRSGPWLVCGPGCAQCCIGPFAITQLDALRLRAGLARLAETDPARAAAVLARARQYVECAAAAWPGNPANGELFHEDALPESMDEVACPVLDPATGVCDLYASRPITCRAFGPVTRVDNGALAACELCYEGASEEEMAACAVEIDPGGIECDLLAELADKGLSGMTIVAWALARSHSIGLPISQ